MEITIVETGFLPRIIFHFSKLAFFFFAIPKTIADNKVEDSEVSSDPIASPYVNPVSGSRSNNATARETRAKGQVLASFYRKYASRYASKCTSYFSEMGEGGGGEKERLGME